MEGKAARVAASECGRRASFNNQSHLKSLNHPPRCFNVAVLQSVAHATRVLIGRLAKMNLIPHIISRL